MPSRDAAIAFPGCIDRHPEMQYSPSRDALIAISCTSIATPGCLPGMHRSPSRDASVAIPGCSDRHSGMLRAIPGCIDLNPGNHRSPSQDALIAYQGCCERLPGMHPSPYGMHQSPCRDTMIAIPECMTTIPRCIDWDASIGIQGCCNAILKCIDRHPRMPSRDASIAIPR